MTASKTMGLDRDGLDSTATKIRGISNAGTREPDDASLVTVVVPAYNAEKTIEETLHSIRAQTYRNLEILVIDDGSTDNTARIVADHVQNDPRMRLISQPNSGVAAARNRGVAEAASEFIAPVDADDLWRPTKIAKQMALMLSRGNRVGLVYTWQAIINSRSHVLTIGHQAHDEGPVLPNLFRRNFIGSGSSPLMRKQAILEAGGYDTSLLASAAQGCEDLKLYLKIAERYEFAVVKECLTGYRRTPGNMSSDALQMLRSSNLVFAEFLQAYPQYRHLIRQGRTHMLRWLFQSAVRTRELRPIGVMTMEILKADPRYLLTFLYARIVRRPLRRLRRTLAILSRNKKRERAIRFLSLRDLSEAQLPETRQ